MRMSALSRAAAAVSSATRPARSLHADRAMELPIDLVVIKLAPALLAGCTVVIKPASPTPLSIRVIVQAVAAAGVPAAWSTW